jgi:hypothetical protein
VELYGQVRRAVYVEGLSYPRAPLGRPGWNEPPTRELSHRPATMISTVKLQTCRSDGKTLALRTEAGSKAHSK